MTEYYADNTLEHNVYMRSGKASEFGELVYQESGMDVDQSSLVFEITRECVYYVVGTWRRAFRKGKVFKCEAQPSGTIDPLVKTYSDEFVTIGTARELGPFSEYFSGDIYYDSTICIVPSCREVAAAAYKEEMLLMMSADDVAVFCTAKTALDALEARKNSGDLNNNGVIRMVDGYFTELGFIFAELFRVCKPGALVAFVNDNVRYGGEVIPVDFLSTNIAESFGFTPEKVYCLRQQKGNSSQQMAKYGRVALRKSITIWRKNC